MQNNLRNVKLLQQIFAGEKTNNIEVALTKSKNLCYVTTSG